MRKNYVIMVAGGTGSRMGSTIPKQFIPIHGQPILMHSMNKFAAARSKPEIVLVISKDMEDYWKELCDTHHFTLAHHCCYGGSTRFQSVKNGLAFIQSIDKEEVIIAIHDAARPLLSTHLIDKLFDACTDDQPAIIPAVQSSNSVRIGLAEASEAINRDLVWLVQTPQVFDSKLLYKAYEQEETAFFTDDASVVEKLSNNLLLMAGEHQNLKITYEQDLAIAQLLIPAN